MRKFILNKKTIITLIFLPLTLILIFLIYILIVVNVPPKLSYMHSHYEKYHNGNYYIDKILNDSNNEFVNINDINIDSFDKDTKIIIKKGNLKINNKKYKISPFENEQLLYYKITKDNNTIGYFEENFSNDTIILNIINNDNKILKIIFKNK